MKRWNLWLIFAVTCLPLAAMLVDCGGGGGGGGAAPLSPPAFTNLAGTSWSTTDTVSAANSCGVNVGVTDYWTAKVLAQSGNSISVYDTRAGSSQAINGTMSGYVVTISGPRYPVGGCSNMTGSYTVTFNTAGTSFSGTATLTCLDNTGCTVPVTTHGTKI